MKLEGMVDIAKKTLRLPAVLGVPSGVSSVIDEVNDPAYATAVGLTIWGHSIKSVSKKRFNFNLKGLGQVSDQLRKWLKALIP